ncbi:MULTISPECIES: hypothetical protein [unclassified Roseateles]|uniref:hypothetical protein n=1 Tax=unclassified Roseateles TaxID=2626991 RepID=UPI000701851F|nr:MULTISPECIES: hypothetical protein [unclassified Roseateles]KQW46610.1 hypothetical protein ASC81_09485 [Pelomonas sp. Root405]KRA73661.1 hypothetical protein ASD88_09485 [Pelomonas sp. Root662]
MNGVSDARQLDRLELVALGYLLAPMVLFFWGWWRWPVALVLSGLLACSGHVVVKRCQHGAQRLSGKLWLAIGAVALIWVGSSGLLGVLPLNEDWSVRMVVLRDLTLGAWPVGYGELGGGEAVLRFSMGYYLIPAGLGAWLSGVESARLLLGLWTALGVMLFFALVIQSWPSRRPVVIAGLLAVLVFFSGMDMLGFLLEKARSPEFGEHIEWWAPWLQYSSQTTLVFWAPNHALPGWLGAALVWRHREAGLALAPAALLLLAGALWSPLACVGLLPLLALTTLRHQPLQRWVRELMRPAVLAALPLLALLAVFVSFGIVTDALPAEGRELVEVVAAKANWYQLVCFGLLEWGFLAAALLAAGPRRQGWVFWAACALLLVLPLLRFGPGNDLVMRAGIAPVALLMLCAARALHSGEMPDRWRAALALMLCIGAITPGQELARQMREGSRWLDNGSSMARYRGHAWHYVGTLRPGWLALALRQPVRLP